MPVDDIKTSGASAVVPQEHIVFTDLDGHEGVLVDLNTRKYYQLNETAMLIWRGLEKRIPLDEIAKELTEIYDVTLERAKLSVEKALRHFAAQKFIGPGDLA